MRPDQALPQMLTWAATPQGTIVMVDDDGGVLVALGQWLELRNLGASRHGDGASLLQAVHAVQWHLIKVNFHNQATKPPPRWFSLKPFRRGQKKRNRANAATLYSPPHSWCYQVVCVVG